MLSAHETVSEIATCQNTINHDILLKGLIMERVYGLRPHFLLPDESRKSGSGISADFGYTSICDALTKRAKETTMSPREINRIAFNRELPEKKVPVEVFERIAQKARNSMRVISKFCLSKIIFQLSIRILICRLKIKQRHLLRNNQCKNLSKNKSIREMAEMMRRYMGEAGQNYPPTTRNQFFLICRR